jgi:DnaJ-class molecular chaperone
MNEAVVIRAFEGLRTCPACCGTGTLWIWDGSAASSIPCWHCFGSGTFYDSTQGEP